MSKRDRIKRRNERQRVELQIQAVQALEMQNHRIIELEARIEAQRGMLFGAFLGRALGDEPKLSDAFLEQHASWFKGCPEEPWMVFQS